MQYKITCIRCGKVRNAKSLLRRYCSIKCKMEQQAENKDAQMVLEQQARENAVAEAAAPVQSVTPEEEPEPVLAQREAPQVVPQWVGTTAPIPLGATIQKSPTGILYLSERRVNEEACVACGDLYATDQEDFICPSCRRDGRW